MLGLPEIKAGYDVPRRTFIGTKEVKHCGWYPDRTVRLFDRTKARFSKSLVHECVEVRGETGSLQGDLLHYSYAGIGDMLPKIGQYSDLWAQQMHAAGKRNSFVALLIKPLAAFIKTYLLKRGALDGFEGLVISVSTAFLTFLKYAKLRGAFSHCADTNTMIVPPKSILIVNIRLIGDVILTTSDKPAIQFGRVLP